jgi:lipoprotein-anchoring transpeptidase ErfK/SrfK
MLVKKGRRRAIGAAVALAAVLAGVPALAGAAPGARGPKLSLSWRAPTPADGAALTVAAGSPLTLELSAASSQPSELVLIGGRDRPPGSTLASTYSSPGTGTFTWTPTVAQSGEHVLTFTAQTHDLPRVHAQPRSFLVYVRDSRPRAKTDPFPLGGPRGMARWAAVKRAIPARAEPNASSRVVTRLKTQTPEHVQNVVLALSGRIDERGRYWVRVRLPILPNGSTGWVPRSALGPYRTIYTRLVVDRDLFTATLYRRGVAVFRTRVGVGKAHWPTPRGEFHVREKLTGFSDPIYGPLAFGLNARSAVLTDWLNGGFIGIHGTNQPQILPGRVSHGCIRMRNDAIRQLARLMPIGTPVTIH